MSAIKINRNTIIVKQPVKETTLCYHCGTPCSTTTIVIDDKAFCCEGCKLVYEILNENGLCDYYTLQSHPGLSRIKSLRNDKFSYLDNEEIAKQLYTFTDGRQIIVTLYLPDVHCASCMWLLEHMNRLNEGIIESRLNYTAKEVTIRFVKDKISLRQIVELLTTIGYEPHISLDDANGNKRKTVPRSLIYKLGVAGFCFGNIMMLSFPEYLSLNLGIEHQYQLLFRIISLILSLPVFFYSASEFFVSAWKGLQQKMLNIDAPIALALIITFSRSIYEIASGTGSGFLDSMSGIVFFMLVGRIVQERTYSAISFHRDYKAYFPIAVNVVTPEGIRSRKLQDLKEKDVVQLHFDEIIPADAIVVKGNAKIDYSFVTGESEPVSVEGGAMVYAGGRQTGEQLTIQIVKPVAGSYLTSLWNHYSFTRNKEAINDRQSMVHLLSKYFTYILLLLAAVTAVYWWVYDPSKVLPSVSAMLIVACPCALLLAATYTNGNLLRIFSNNGLFLRDATVIEQLGKIDHIVFDKTGTLTQGSSMLTQEGTGWTEEEKRRIYAVAASSKHPYSKIIAQYTQSSETLPVQEWKETVGKGVQGIVEGCEIFIGTADFTSYPAGINRQPAAVYVRMDNKLTALYITPHFRPGVPGILQRLKEKYALSLISGDHHHQRKTLEQLFGTPGSLLFEQKPIDKLHYIEHLQEQHAQVLMIGDGLNDAGALQQSNVGITLADDINNFTPSCDAILDAKRFERFPSLMQLARSGKGIISFSFFISIIYNVIGLYISMRGQMSPMIAAILMPISTLSIVLITTGASSLLALKYRLSLKQP